MGVPDFLKFISRAAPGALCRIPRGGAAVTLCFDFILVDATNAAQTIGLEALGAFLRREQVHVRQAVVFAVDGQRHRGDAARAQRTHATVLDADVTIQQFGSDLQRYYEDRGGEVVPQVLISGRNVAGEADYKILDIQRFIITQVLAGGGCDKLPTFCLISEDSDVLCGALCGPAPHTISIVTKLRDTMIDMCVLRIPHVLTHVGVCMEAFISGAEVNVGEGEGNYGSGEAANGAFNVVGEKPQPPVVRHKEDLGEPVARRKKVDGPMISTGARIVLSDSDDDNERKVENPIHPPSGDSDKIRVPPSAKTAVACGTTTAYHAAVAEIIQNSCVDMVFLFIIVMGNGGNVPPVIRGATKVDIQSCWGAYCKMKYNTAESEREKEMGRTLIGLNDAIHMKGQQQRDVASIVVDCSFLSALLDAAQYAGAESRPTTDEDKEQALLYLSQVTYATLRYIVACNVRVEAAGRTDETFLDTRQPSEAVSVPNVAAFFSVLNQTRKRTLHFPIVGLAPTSVLLNAPKGVTAVEESMVAARRPSNCTQGHVVLKTDVTSTLTSVEAFSGVHQFVSLRKFLAPFVTADASRRSVLECVKRYSKSDGRLCEEVKRLGMELSPFSKLLLVWRRTMELCVPSLELIATKQRTTLALGNGAGEAVATVGTRSEENVTGGTPAKMSYSFELRRMAPVLVDEKMKQGDAAVMDSKRREVLMKALRVSHDYAQSTQPVSSQVTRPPAPSGGDAKNSGKSNRGRSARNEVVTSKFDGVVLSEKRRRVKSVPSGSKRTSRTKRAKNELPA